jgi:hypothetical protein
MKAIRTFVAALAVILIIPVAASAAKVVLAEETEVKVSFDPEIRVNSGMLQVGLSVPIILAEDITIGGKTIVEKGAPGTAEVLEIERASRPGDPGYIKIGFRKLSPRGEYSTATGEMIKLSGEVENRGKSRKVLSWLFILGLFLSGKEGELDSSQVYTAEVAETVIMETG